MLPYHSNLPLGSHSCYDENQLTMLERGIDLRDHGAGYVRYPQLSNPMFKKLVSAIIIAIIIIASNLTLFNQSYITVLGQTIGQGWLCSLSFCLCSVLAKLKPSSSTILESQIGH